jgi:type II secretory pathway pseudopilin PulG
MTVSSQTRQDFPRQDERGYILLTLLLAMALIVIFAAVILPSITFEIQRDREEEMIHRGVQYSRAIRAYYKKFGRYPTRLEDLENSNNLRFLRKRYKDPINCVQGKCQDFKLLHFGEVKLSFSGGIGGGMIPGANPIGSPGGLNAPGGFGQNSTLGGNSGFGANSNTSFGQNQFGQNPPSQNQQTGNNPPSEPDASQSSSQEGTNQPGMTPVSEMPGGDKSSAEQQVIASGPIVGVASASKKKTIREFNHKKKYNEWQFIYDPATDRGGLLMTPNQPPLQGFGQQGMQNLSGQGASGQSGTGSGFGNSFGNSPSGTQNNPLGPGTTSQPSNPPQQQ